MKNERIENPENLSTSKPHIHDEGNIKPVPFKGQKLQKDEMAFNFNIAFQEEDYVRIENGELHRLDLILENTKALAEQLLRQINLVMCLKNQITNEIQVNKLSKNG